MISFWFKRGKNIRYIRLVLVVVWERKICNIEVLFCNLEKKFRKKEGIILVRDFNMDLGLCKDYVIVIFFCYFWIFF